MRMRTTEIMRFLLIALLIGGLGIVSLLLGYGLMNQSIILLISTGIVVIIVVHLSLWLVLLIGIYKIAEVIE